MLRDTIIQLGKINSLWGVLLILAIALVIYIATLIIPAKRSKK